MLYLPLTRFGPAARITSTRIVSKSLRRLAAMGIAALLLIAPLGLTSGGFTASAQQISSTKPSGRKHFVLYLNPAGEVACRAATLAEAGELDKVDTSTQRLQQINHLQSDRYAHRRSKANGAALSATNLTIILRATTQLQGNQAAVDAFNRAAQNWETVILSPITIYIDVDFGPNNSFNNNQPFPAGVLGSTSTTGSFYPYSLLRANLIAEANGEGNATKQAIFNALPSTSVPTDLGNAGTTDVNSTIARAIGLSPAVAQSSDLPPQIAFNSNFTYDFDPSNGISGGTDFDAVATHEIGHALGFESDDGFSSTTATPSVWDLYRFRTGTTSGTFSTAQRVMTIGGSPDPLQFDFIPGNLELGLSNGGPTTGTTTNGADGWQSSHWKHVSGCTTPIGIMDPAIPSNCRRTITLSDQLALASFGYNLTNSNPPPGPPPPPANDNFANAQIISGCSGSVNGTNIGATQEAGEPANPDSPSSKTSVWYQWQAPSTGNVTFDTIGSDFDTVLAVYSGTTLSTLGTAIAHNDDRSQTPHEITSLVTFPATQGTIYRIEVAGFDNGGGGDVGGIKLNWTEANCAFPTPAIITEDGATSKAVAIDSVTFLRGPFSVTGTNNFSSDQHTRVILFTSPNLGLTVPDPSILTVQAGGTSLTVENVGTLTGVAGLDASYIVVRLPTGLATGDLPLTVTFHGVSSSNNPTLSIIP